MVLSLSKACPAPDWVTPQAVFLPAGGVPGQPSPCVWTAQMGGTSLPSPAARIFFVVVYVGCASMEPTDVVRLGRVVAGGKRGIKQPLISDIIRSDYYFLRGVVRKARLGKGPPCWPLCGSVSASHPDSRKLWAAGGWRDSPKEPCRVQSSSSNFQAMQGRA